MVHVREGTDDDLLVVGVLLDASMYGTNNMVRPPPPPPRPRLVSVLAETFCPRDVVEA